MNIKRTENKNQITNEKASVKEALSVFLQDFPNNAISWIDATQEVSTIAKWISEELNIKIPTDLISTPAAYNTKFKTFIFKHFDKLNEVQLQFFERDFKHWLYKDLFESVDIVPSEDTSLKPIKDLTLSKTKKFELDNGLYFETINSGKIDNKISLKWHVNNTFNVDEFIESVNAVVAVTEQELSENDIARLVAHYNKYSLK